ncbi:MAG: hypothetical protein OXN83_00945 [Oligoflexia bacterium]|nr:hypothetical protein [Oligoflexia bacterium]
MLSSHYVTEVLGVKNYLCPSFIHALRHLEGGWPCHFLVVVFKKLNSSQKALLKKIMSSIGVFKYSVLEVEEERILDGLFEKTDCLAQFIFFFGGKDFVQEGKLFRQEGQLLSAFGDNIGCSFFQTASSLEELEDNSSTVKEKKQELWKQLKLWKSASQF